MGTLTAIRLVRQEYKLHGPRNSVGGNLFGYRKQTIYTMCSAQVRGMQYHLDLVCI